MKKHEWVKLAVIVMVVFIHFFLIAVWYSAQGGSAPIIYLHTVSVRILSDSMRKTSLTVDAPPFSSIPAEPLSLKKRESYNQPLRPFDVKKAVHMTAKAMGSLPSESLPGESVDQLSEKRVDEREVVVNQAPPKIESPVIDFSRCQQPSYPVRALRAGEEGVVSLAFFIAADGRVDNITILRSSGSILLDRAAQDALRLCHFKPGTINGQPQPARTTVDYIWRLPE